MTERQGIEIDYCPQCRGIWLDRGELDKLIERSGVSDGQSGLNASQQSYNNHEQHDYNNHDQHDYTKQNQHGYYNNQKKKSWLNELFD
jgi:Zn-finger nucleic acid-binding protein